MVARENCAVTQPIGSRRGGGVSVRRVLLPLTLLWLAGAGLPLTVLAVPPVLPAIHADLNLSETQVGILTGLPSLLFALAAVPGSLLIARLGPVTALAIGLLLDGVAA